MHNTGFPSPIPLTSPHASLTLAHSSNFSQEHIYFNLVTLPLPSSSWFSSFLPILLPASPPQHTPPSSTLPHPLLLPFPPRVLRWKGRPRWLTWVLCDEFKVKQEYLWVRPGHLHAPCKVLKIICLLPLLSSLLPSFLPSPIELQKNYLHIYLNHI